MQLTRVLFVLPAFALAACPLELLELLEEALLLPEDALRDLSRAVAKLHVLVFGHFDHVLGIHPFQQGGDVLALLRTLTKQRGEALQFGLGLGQASEISTINPSVSLSALRR